jgi:hypothetical protein
MIPLSLSPLPTAKEHQLSHIKFTEDWGKSDTFAVLIDDGKAGSTTNNCSNLYGYKPLTTHKTFHDDGKRSHISAGEGYMRLACGTSAEVSNTYVNIHCYHTPTLPVTVLYPGRFVTHHELTYQTQKIYATHCTKRGYARIYGLVDVPDIYIPGSVYGALLYSRTSSPSSEITKCESLIGHDAYKHDVDAVNHLNFEATRILWHQRFVHMHLRKLSELHKHVDCIPKIALPIDIHGCPSWCV